MGYAHIVRNRKGQHMLVRKKKYDELQKKLTIEETRNINNNNRILQLEGQITGLTTAIKTAGLDVFIERDHKHGYVRIHAEQTVDLDRALLLPAEERIQRLDEIAIRAAGMTGQVLAAYIREAIGIKYHDKN